MMSSITFQDMGVYDDGIVKRRRQARRRLCYILTSITLNGLMLIALLIFFLRVYWQYKPFIDEVKAKYHSIVKDIIDKYWNDVINLLNMIPETIQLIKNATEVVNRLKRDLAEAEKILHKIDPSFIPENLPNISNLPNITYIPNITNINITNIYNAT